MTMNKLTRQTHRWLAIVFTATVLLNIVVLSVGDPIAWVTYSPLLPLFLMMATGLYMFFQPYAAKRRRATRAG